MSEPVEAYEPLLTPEEVARIFKVSEDTVRQMVRKGDLYAIQFGRQYRIPKSVVDAFFRYPKLDRIERITLRLYQEDLISTGKLGDLLGLDFYQTLDYLKAHHVSPRLGPEDRQDAQEEASRTRRFFAR